MSIATSVVQGALEAFTWREGLNFRDVSCSGSIGAVRLIGAPRNKAVIEEVTLTLISPQFMGGSLFIESKDIPFASIRFINADERMLMIMGFADDMSISFSCSGGFFVLTTRKIEGGKSQG